MSILDQSFFARPVLQVAPELLGKYLVRKRGAVTEAYKIVEVEAYDGVDDLACHASKGKTPRTEVMFGPAGVWYVYLIYGIYDMLNIVTSEEGYPAAVLIRGVESINGPGRLTRALSIDRSFNKQPVSLKSGLWIEDREEPIETASIITTPRIGVAYAGSWAEKPWRFVLTDRQDQ